MLKDAQLRRCWAFCHSSMVRTPVLAFQLVQKHLGLAEVSGVKALGEPPVDRHEELVGLTAPALLLPQAGQAGGSSQLHDCPLWAPVRANRIERTDATRRCMVGATRAL